MLKHSVESLASLPYMGMYPVNVQDECPYKVGGANACTGCLKMLDRFSRLCHSTRDSG